MWLIVVLLYVYRHCSHSFPFFEFGAVVLFNYKHMLFIITVL